MKCDFQQQRTYSIVRNNGQLLIIILAYSEFQAQSLNKPIIREVFGDSWASNPFLIIDW